jgi:hypothetical protein
MTKPGGWYPVSLLGIILTSLYALVPPYIVYAQSTQTFPPELQVPILSGMVFVGALMLLCRYTGQKPFLRRSGKARRSW